MTNTKQIVLPKPPLKLAGEDGNAFFIVGRACQAAKEAGWPKEAIRDFQKEALAGSYGDLLRLCNEKFDLVSDDNEDDDNEIDLDDDEDCDEDEDEDGCYIEDFGKTRAELLEDEAAE